MTTDLIRNKRIVQVSLKCFKENPKLLYRPKQSALQEIIKKGIQVKGKSARSMPRKSARWMQEK